mgnify:CR=1 FL=1
MQAAKDKSLVTREELSEGLLQCLTSNEKFCELSLPLLFEKLDSSFQTAKLDSYQLLKACCQKLNASSLQNYLNQFWKCVQNDILNVRNPELSEVGLSALTDVVWLLSKEKKNEQLLFSFLNDVIQSK